MPTASQSQILSVVDYQLLQQNNGQTNTTKPPVRISVNPTAISESKRRNSSDNHLTSSTSGNNRRRSTDKTNDHTHTTARTSQRNDVLRMPVINLNQTAHRQDRSKSNLIDTSYQYNQTTNSDNDELSEYEHRFQLPKTYPTPRNPAEFNSSASELDNTYDERDENNETENGNRERSGSLLNDSTRRLLVLGTIRPSKTFYKNLSTNDVDHLMDYFRRMKNNQQRVTSEDINQELASKHVEYKPKIFFDSACVTKGQVTQIEKMIEQYADRIRTHEAEFVKLENPMRFVIKPVGKDTPLTTIPREFNDCFITLVTRSDPLRKSDLITDLVHDQFLEDVKANSLDISYFPGGVNYDVPREEIDENGQMQIETYQKLKKRLNNRKVRYFSGQPEKKPNALLAILPLDTPITITHQQLYDNLIDRLKSISNEEKTNIEEQIISIEFVPMSCILNSNDTPNEFIIECNTNETKRLLMEKSLKFVANKQTVHIDLQSYDEIIHREYEKFIKSEKYRELIKNHDAAVKRTTATK